MKYFVWLVVFSVVACSGIPLAPRKVRQKHYHLETQVPGNTAYLRALAWLDKHLLPVEGTAMEQMAPEGKLKLRTKVACQLLSPESQAENRFLSFQLTLETRYKAVDAYLEDIKMLDEQGNPLDTAMEQLSSPDQVKKVEPCLNKQIDALRKGIQESKINWE